MNQELKRENHRTIHIGSNVWHYRFGRCNAVIISPAGVKTVVDYDTLTGSEWMSLDKDCKPPIGPSAVSLYIKNEIMMSEEELLERRKESKEWLARNRRCPGKIDSQKFGMDSDHELLTSILMISDDGGCQGFGCGFFKTQEDLDDYKASLCSVFGVKDAKELVGKKCFALRAFGHNNDTIEGLESQDTGKRFLYRVWVKVRFPEHESVSSFEQRKALLEKDIARGFQVATHAEAELEKLKENYTDWENQ